MMEALADYGCRLSDWIMPNEYLINRFVDIGIFATLFTTISLLPMAIPFMSRSFRHTRRRILACAFEIMLYRKRPISIIRSEASLISNNTKCLLLLLPSIILAGMVWFTFTKAFKHRYAYQPCKVGKTVVLGAERTTKGIVHTGSEEVLPMDDEILEIVSRVRAPQWGRYWIHVRPRQAGTHILSTDQKVAGPVLCAGVEDVLVHPFQSVNGVDYRIGYPSDPWWGQRKGYLWVFMCACLGMSLPIARILRIRL